MPRYFAEPRTLRQQKTDQQSTRSFNTLDSVTSNSVNIIISIKKVNKDAIPNMRYVTFKNHCDEIIAGTEDKKKKRPWIFIQVVKSSQLLYLHFRISSLNYLGNYNKYIFKKKKRGIYICNFWNQSLHLNSDADEFSLFVIFITNQKSFSNTGG